MSLMPCNANALLEVTLRNRLPNDDAVSSSSAECLRLEAEVEADIEEEGRIGVVGGIAMSSSLGSWSSLGSVGGSISSEAVLGPANCAFAIAPWVCCEGRKPCTPLAMLGMIAWMV